MSSRNNQTPHCIKRKPVGRRGGKDGQSEAKNKNDCWGKAGEKDGSKQVNGWQGKSNMTARWIEEWGIIKEKEQDM